jgi:vesicle-associated membrane protein 4
LFKKALLFSDDDEESDDKMLELGARGADSKIGRVQSQVKEVLGDMRINVQKIVDRGQNLDELNDRSEELGVTADTFSRRAKGLRKSMWLRTCRARLYLGVAISLVSILLLCNENIPHFYHFKMSPDSIMLHFKVFFYRALSKE